MKFFYFRLAIVVVIMYGIIKESPGQPVPTKVIAHRGAWKNTNTPENSIAALQRAIQMGCYGSEFDVHLSADSIPFVLHDPAIQGIYIEKTNAARLKEIRLFNGEPLPTLEEYLAAGKNQSTTRLVLEIKSSQLSRERSLLLAEKCVALVQRLNVRAITDYIAFDYEVCKKVKSLDSSAIVTYLNGDKSPEELKKDGLDGMDYHFSVYKKNERWLNEAKKLSLITNAWTVNDPETMQWLIDRQVDFITTNEPELLLKLLKSGQ
jgi:glycerophosphoryl diester phosphodiesterase